MSTIQSALEQAWKTHQSGNVAAAESVYRHVIAHQADHAAAHVYLGIALFDQRKFAQSVASYRTALSINPQFPIAWNNLGNSLRMLGDVDRADACFQKAIDGQPGYLSPLKNRGTLWVWAGEIEKGLASYSEALQLAPADPELHRNLGVIYLLQQRYDEGWPEYRWRWHFIPGGRPQYPFPAWQGEDPSGKTFLLYSEQGIGDAIQFVRVGHTLRAAGARTILRCADHLVPLFASTSGIDMIIPQSVPVAQFNTGQIDYHASLIDVVDYWYGRSGELATSVGSVTQAESAYLSVTDSLIGYWNRSLATIAPAAHAPDAGKRRIGICWQGNPQHHADVYRSVPLAEFEPLSQLTNVSLVSLQHGFGKEQLDDVPFGKAIVRLPNEIDQSGGAFLDTAAIIRNLDLVITVDTSTAHLAGALGVPVWLILGRVPDWRWLQHGDTSPWYPAMRLFRQTKLGCWSDVFQAITEDLSVSGTTARST
jgi:Tfp pilus assembly protein PilF